MRFRLGFVVVLATHVAGCQIVEANIRAVEVLASDDATGPQKGFATAVVAGTATALTALAVAGTVAMTTDWAPDDPPPKDYVSSELGWGLEDRGGDVSWHRCTSRIFCTEELVTVPRADLLASSPAGRATPVAMGGGALGEVEILHLEVHRRR